MTYSGKRVLVIGGGHSAANVLLDLARLAESDAQLQLIWAVRSKDLRACSAAETADKLPARGKLGIDLKRLVASGRLQLVTGFSAKHVEETTDGATVTGFNGSGEYASLPAVDRIMVATGQRPDLDAHTRIAARPRSLARMLRVRLVP